MANETCRGCGKTTAEETPDGLCSGCRSRRSSEDTGTVSPTSGSTISHGAAQSPDATRTFGSASGRAVDLGAPPPAVLAHELDGRYTVLHEAARGGMGRVFLVRDAQLGRDMALKQLLASVEDAEGGDSTTARFTREARITAQLQHPSITPVYELGRRADGSLYYTMKFVSGRTMSAALKDATSLEARLKLIPNFVALCHAIAFAHSRGVIHRDIKPSNVMIGEFGETVVVDWGLAKVKGVADPVAGAATAQVTDDIGSLTVAGTTVGTPAYMPPEQAEGRIEAVDERSDIYSLGAVLYEILTGERPYSGNSSQDVLESVLKGAPSPVRKVVRAAPREYVALCEQAMARDPAKRLASAVKFAELVQNVRLRPAKGSFRRVIEALLIASGVVIPTALWLVNERSDAALAQVRQQLVSRGIKLGSGQVDVAAAASLRSLSTDASGTALSAIYSLPWEYPQLGNGALAQATRGLEILVNRNPFPWPAGSAEAARVRVIVAGNAQLLARIRVIATLPQGNLEHVISMITDPEEPFDLKPPKGGFEIGRLLAYESYLAQLDGSPDLALASTTSGLAFSERLLRVPSFDVILGGQLVSETVLVAADCMDLRAASERALAEAEVSLRRTSVLPSIDQALEREIRSVGFYFDRLRNDWTPRIVRGPVPKGGGFTTPSWFYSLGLIWYGKGSFRFLANEDEILNYRLLADTLDVVRRPRERAIVDIKRINRGRRGYVQRMFLPSGGSAGYSVARSSLRRVAVAESRISVLRLRIALERYRKLRGGYPLALQELIPDLLDVIPLDLQLARPIDYQRMPVGYRLGVPDVTKFEEYGSLDTRPIGCAGPGAS